MRARWPTSTDGPSERFRGGPARLTNARATLLALASRYGIWLTPFFVYLVVRREEAKAARGIEYLIAAGILVFLIRRPYRALSALIIGLPFATIVLSTLLRLGVPGSVVRALGYWKEAMVLGIALAALRQLLNRSASRWVGRFDRADVFVVSYLALGTLYLFLPGLFVGTGAGSQLSLYARELGWRSDVLYLGLFLVVRYCGLTVGQVNRLFRQFVAVSMVVAAVGIFEFFATKTWLNFVTKTVKLAVYDSRVLGIANPTVQETYGSIGGHHFARIGSVILNYLDAGFYLAFAVAITIELFTRGRSAWWIRLALPLIGVALVLNQGRAALVAGVVATLLGLRTQIGRSVAHAERVGFALAIGLLAFIPVIVTTGLAHRFVSSQNDNTGHITATKQGIHAMSTHPLGTGLATGAGGGQLAALKGLETTATFLVTEDQYLQIGVQLGIAGLIVYLLSLLYLVRALRAPPSGPKDVSYSGPAFGARNGLIGLLVAGLVLQPFSSPAVDWIVFALCGAGAVALDSYKEIQHRELATVTGPPISLSSSMAT